VIPYRLPLAEQPRVMRWDAGTDEHGTPGAIAWWESTRIVHGGRQNTPVVQASNGYAYVFNTRGSYIGAVEASGGWRGGLGAPEFWRLERPGGDEFAHWLDAEAIRSSGCILAQVDGVTGVVARADHDTADRPWRVAYACVLLGFYPPMGLDLPPTAETFLTGVQVVGDRPARRIKRAILSRLALERRSLRERAELIEGNWR
jgi:hypothetical protein